MQQRYDNDRAALYERYGEQMPCPFCDIRNRRKLESTETMVVLRNDYPYEYFDGRHIKEHYMIVPKRHVNVMNAFTPLEQDEYWRLLTKYQLLEYANFTRSAGDLIRTVSQHLHTHLFSYQDRT